jgi:hypothetical protein
MNSVTKLLASGIILVSLAGCKKTPTKDAVWNRDNLGAIVEIEPVPDDYLPNVSPEELETEEEHWCNA